MKISAFFEKYSSYHIAVLRIGTGLFMFFTWGLGKLLAGPERWERLGGAMAAYGITIFPTFWGFMAMFSQTFAALMIAVGLFTRYNAMLLGFTFLTIIVSGHINDILTGNFAEFGTSFYILLCCITLILSGGGEKLNLERKLFGKEF